MITPVRSSTRGGPRVLLVGHGCREAALASSIAREGVLLSVMAVRNPLIAHLSSAVTVVDAYDVESVVKAAREFDPEFVMIGPEEPIARGVADALGDAGFAVCAPSSRAALLESDKAYMRTFLEEHCPDLNVPFQVVSTEGDIRSLFQDPQWPVAVKPVGLAGGKGAKVEGVQLRDSADAAQYAVECLGTTRQPVLVEQRVDGVEYTLHCVTDGAHSAFFPATYDYSYRDEGDRGPQTGGMGSYSASEPWLPFMTKADYDASCDAMLRVLAALKETGVSYRGVFQGQFFLTGDGLKICEFACRLGDPETVNILQVLVPSWVDVMDAVEHGGVGADLLKVRTESSVAVCLAPPGYPSPLEGAHRFTVDDAVLDQTGVEFVPGGCEADETSYLARGGRAGALCAAGATIAEARRRIEIGLSAVRGLEHRSDVATQADIEHKIGRVRRWRLG